MTSLRVWGTPDGLPGWLEESLMGALRAIGDVPLHPLHGDTAVVGGLSLGGCHVLVPLGMVVLPLISTFVFRGGG